jgi:hypothetical protein
MRTIHVYRAARDYFVGGVLNVEICHSMPLISTCFIECKTFGRNHHLHFQNTTATRKCGSVLLAVQFARVSRSSGQGRLN